MKFRLHESLPYITLDDIKKWQTATEATRRDMTDGIIKQYHKPGLENIKDAIYNNFDYFGIDKDDNPFMQLLDELEFAPEEKENSNFTLLTQYQKAGKVDLSHDYLRMKSLYDRSRNDFDYTLNAFEIVMDKSELSKYFNDITNIDSSQFIDPETNEILPAGKPGDKGLDTIYGVIEQWSNENSSSNSTSKDLKYTLSDVFNHFKVPENKQSDVGTLWLKTYYTRISKTVKPKSDDPRYYVTEFQSIMSADKVKLTNAARNEILKSKRYSTADDVPVSERKEGNIVYLQEFSHDSSGKNMLDDMIDNYVVYHNGKWITYETYVIEVKQDRKSKLLRMKSVAVVNDKSEAAAGIVRAIDKISADEERSNDINNFI